MAAETLKTASWMALESALVARDHTTDFQFDTIVAEWPEFTGPISIGMASGVWGVWF
jgi:hypothetical protein